MRYMSVNNSSLAKTRHLVVQKPGRNRQILVEYGPARPQTVSLVAWGVQVHEANVPSARLPLAVLIPGLSLDPKPKVV